MYLRTFLSSRQCLLLCVGWMLLGGSVSFAQEKEGEFAPNTREAAVEKRRPSSDKADKRAKRKHKPDSKVELRAHYEQLEKEYEERLKKQAKEHKKKQRRLRQNKRRSDPSYFGHKRKPKRRSPGRRKLCKECGIIH